MHRKHCPSFRGLLGRAAVGFGGLLILGAGLMAEAHGARVYQASSGNVVYDAALKSVLEGGGHSVVIGKEWSALDGSEDFRDIDVVFFPVNYNSTGKLSATAESRFIRSIGYGGRGLVTTAWLNRNLQESDLLFYAMPAFSPNFAFRSDTGVEFTRSGMDPVIHAGLPDAVSFTATDIGGTESLLLPKIGVVGRADATTFFTTKPFPGFPAAAGVVGSSYYGGRVVNFSVLLGEGELGNPDLARLIVNSVAWAAEKDVTPPTILTKQRVVTRRRSVRLRGTVEEDREMRGLAICGKLGRTKFCANLMPTGSWTLPVKWLKRRNSRVVLTAEDWAGNTGRKPVVVIKRGPTKSGS